MIYNELLKAHNARFSQYILKHTVRITIYTHIHPMKIHSKQVKGQDTENSCLFAQDVFTYSCHKHGCRVIQRLMSQCEDMPCRAAIVEMLRPNFLQLSTHMYGNFVIEALIDPCNKCNEYNEYVVLSMQSKIARTPEVYLLAWTLMPHLAVSCITIWGLSWGLGTGLRFVKFWISM